MTLTEKVGFNEYVQYASRRYLAYGENTHTLRLISELVDLRAGYAKWFQ